MYVTLKSSAFVVASAFAPTLCPGGVSLPSEGADGSSTAEASSSSTSASSTAPEQALGSSSSQSSSTDSGSTESKDSHVGTTAGMSDTTSLASETGASGEETSAAGSSTTEGQEPHCGDGTVDLGEQCDDANGIADDFCDNDCMKNFRAFITSAAYRGDFSVFEDADKLCDDAGAKFEDGEPVVFKAWLATKMSAPRTDFSEHLRSSTKSIHMLRDGELVELVSSWGELTSGNANVVLSNSLKIDEDGEEHDGIRAWTNVSAKGERVDDNDCGEWKSLMYGVFSAMGRYGVSDSKKKDWTEMGVFDLLIRCDEYAHLYCFSQ